MPPMLTQVARVSDGLPLVATMTAQPGSPVTNKQQQEAKDILRSLNTQYVRNLVVNWGLRILSTLTLRYIGLLRECL
jgi:hypothetical protein